MARLTRFFNQSNDSPCPYCRNKSTGKRLDLKSYSERVSEKYPYLEVLEFTKMHDKAKFKCHKCNETFSITANTLFLKNRFRGCPMCTPTI